MAAIEFDVFGRRVVVVRSGPGWQVFYRGTEGKRRAAPELMVPGDVSESQLGRYLADLCHEWATEQHPDVRRLE